MKAECLLCYTVFTHERVGTFDDLIYNDLLTYAVIVLNGDSKAHLEVVTEYQPLDQAQLLSCIIMKQTIGEIPYDDQLCMGA